MVMKYDVLNAYRSYLQAFVGLRPQTAKKYFEKMDFLLEGQNPLDLINNIDLCKILEILATIKYKNYFSQAKSALVHFLKFSNITLDGTQLKLIEGFQMKTVKKYRKLYKLTPSTIEVIKNKIKRIKNPRLRLSYETLIATGLRVSELAQIKPSTVILENDSIVFSVVIKGGDTRKVTIEKNEYKILYESLLERISNTKLEERIFYTATILQKEASKLGFKCHDLRRICAKDEYRKSKSKWKVKQKLGHIRMKNTNIYLKS